MRVLFTGNLGYIGSALTVELAAAGQDVTGLDIGYFRDCLLAEAPPSAGIAACTVTAFRPSTVFGASPRLRSDMVFNNLAGCAFARGRIEIRSDGTPWRPVVHERDVCQAFMAGLMAPESLVQGRAFNVGIPNGNSTVRDLAEAASRSMPGCGLTAGRRRGRSGAEAPCVNKPAAP